MPRKPFTRDPVEYAEVVRVANLLSSYIANYGAAVTLYLDADGVVRTTIRRPPKGVRVVGRYEFAPGRARVMRDLRAARQERGTTA